MSKRQVLKICGLYILFVGGLFADGFDCDPDGDGGRGEIVVSFV